MWRVSSSEIATFPLMSTSDAFLFMELLIGVNMQGSRFLEIV